MINIVITISIILKELQDQFIKDILSDIFYNILDYILNDIIELNLRLTIFYNYIIELPELCKILKKDI